MKMGTFGTIESQSINARSGGRKETNMEIYIVEYRSNSFKICPFSGDDFYSMVRAHVASSLAKARKFCRDHSDYGGNPKKKYNYNNGYGFVPWHWEIKKIVVDQDDCCTSPIPTQHIESRTPAGKLIKEKEIRVF